MAIEKHIKWKVKPWVKRNFFEILDISFPNAYKEKERSANQIRFEKENSEGLIIKNISELDLEPQHVLFTIYKYFSVEEENETINVNHRKIKNTMQYMIDFSFGKRYYICVIVKGINYMFLLQFSCIGKESEEIKKQVQYIIDTIEIREQEG